MEPLYHQLTQRQLAAISARSGSYIFYGDSGSGRHLAAVALAQRLNCPRGGADDCATCRSIAGGGFTDLLAIDSGGTVGIEQIQQLGQPLAQRPFSAASARVVIIELDHGITAEAQNRLLKTLEEPPAQTVIILVTNNLTVLAATVKSRCQLIHFIALPAAAINSYLAGSVGADTAASVSGLQPISIGEALRLVNNSEMRQAYEADSREAADFIAAGIFRRLVMAQSVRSKSRAQTLIAVMARQTAAARSSLQRFGVLERAQAELDANVGPRVVMEALALTL